MNPTWAATWALIPVAAFDPIFYAHHTMIDRLWYLWQVQEWRRTTSLPNYLNEVLAPFGATVKQVLDINALGYEYASSSAAAVPVERPRPRRAEGRTLTVGTEATENRNVYDRRHLNADRRDGSRHRVRARRYRVPRTRPRLRQL